MKYDPDAIFAEIMRRGQRLSRRRYILKTTSLTAAATVLLLLSSGVIVTLSESREMSVTDSFYGAFMLSPQAGGYVLVGMIAFALGVVFTLMCKKIKNKNNIGKEDQK